MPSPLNKPASVLPNALYLYALYALYLIHCRSQQSTEHYVVESYHSS